MEVGIEEECLERISVAPVEARTTDEGTRPPQSYAARRRRLIRLEPFLEFAVKMAEEGIRPHRTADEAAEDAVVVVVVEASACPVGVSPSCFGPENLAAATANDDGRTFFFFRWLRDKRGIVVVVWLGSSVDCASAIPRSRRSYKQLINRR